MLNQLFVSEKYSKMMVEVGINPLAHLFHGMIGIVIPDDDKTNTAGLFPAWTKQEIDTMIGMDFPKPDHFRRDEHNKSRQNPLLFPIYYPEQMKTFTNGADASADVLLYLIENKHLTVKEVNNRYKEMYKL